MNDNIEKLNKIIESNIIDLKRNVLECRTFNIDYNNFIYGFIYSSGNYTIYEYTLRIERERSYHELISISRSKLLLLLNLRNL